MNNQHSRAAGKTGRSFFHVNKPAVLGISAVVIAGVVALIIMGSGSVKTPRQDKGVAKKSDTATSPKTQKSSANPVASASNLSLDTALYRKKLLHIINGDSSGRWPVKTDYPNAGAIFPFKRVIAYYGNLYSKGMGILGELPPKQMMGRLNGEVKKWQQADPEIEVIPALHYIAATAQISPGNGGKYRLRMPNHQIDSVLSMAKQINAIVFLDIQIGLSTLQDEIPALLTYLKLPNVHLGIDPEFSMKTGRPPGKVVGTFDAADINYATDYLARLVKENNLPPKILVVHRFTQGMVTNYKQIKTRPEVQIVMHMDGWGGGAKKLNTYQQYIYKEPVQFTGFKIFYKNDSKSNGRILTPQELLKLKPQPVYIQYQ